MPRNYKKKKHMKYSAEDLTAAIEEVRSGTLSLYSAAKKYNVPQTTLFGQVKGTHGRKAGRPSRLTEEEESTIVETCLIFSEWGYGLGKKEILSIIHDYLVTNKKTHLFPKGVPNDDWWNGFMKRHPQLSLRKAQALQICRAKASTPEIINHWFMNVLKPILDKTGLADHPNRIFNANETSFSLCGRPQKIIAKRGAKSPQYVIGGTGKENITVQACISASGQLLPPYILYTGQRLMFDQTQGGPLGTRYGVAPKGWMTEVNFLDWFRNLFIPALPEERPVLLILDGHKSHIKYEVRELAKKHLIEIAKLPSHATHLLQPLDLGIFKPLKESYDSSAHKFFLQHRRYINKKDFPPLLAEAWKSFKPTTAKNSFKKAGIVPFDKSVISQSSLDPSVPYTADDIETTEGNSGNGTFDEDPDPSDTHNSDPLSLLELLENEIEHDLLETAPVSIPTSISTPTTVQPSTHNNSQLNISHVASPTTPNAPVTIPTSVSVPTTVQPSTHNNSQLNISHVASPTTPNAPVSIPTSISTPTTVQPSMHNNSQLNISHVASPTTPNAPVTIPTSVSVPTTVQPSTHNNSHSNISHVTSPTTPNADNVSIKDFFINFLQSKTPIRPTTKRRRRVASLGESLTADEAMAKQKEDEEKKKQAEEEKERKRKLRMEKKEMKLKQLNKKQKKKEQKATTTVSMRKSCRKRKRMAETNWEEICGVCMEEWSDETNEEQLWIECESCNSWFYAACVGHSDKDTEELLTISYTCNMCSI